MTAVLTLLAHGCPPQAIVAAFGLDERTVAAWLRRAGAQCAALHGHLVATGQGEVGQAQADEIRVKVRGGAGRCGRPWPWRCRRACGGAVWCPGRVRGHW